MTPEQRKLQALIAKRQALVRRIDELNTDYLSPYRRAEMGNQWTQYAKINRSELKSCMFSLSEINRDIEEIRGSAQRLRQALVAKRIRRIERDEDPSLALLESAFGLIMRSRAEVDYSPEENATIDAIGIYLKKRSGRSFRGNVVEAEG